MVHHYTPVVSLASLVFLGVTTVIGVGCTSLEMTLFLQKTQDGSWNESRFSWEPHYAETEHFLVVSDIPVADSYASDLEWLRQKFILDFEEVGFKISSVSEEKLVLLVLSRKSRLEEYNRKIHYGSSLGQSIGYYSAFTNRIVMLHNYNPYRHQELALQDFNLEEGLAYIDTQTVYLLTHELAHQLAFNLGVQERGVNYPFWFVEGISTNFEGYQVEKVSLLSSNAVRRYRLLEMWRQKNLTPLRQFSVELTLPGESSQEDYAQAWGFFKFLLLEYPEELQQYADDLYQKRLGRRSEEDRLEEFTQAFGQPESLEKEWQDFLRETKEEAEKEFGD